MNRPELLRLLDVQHLSLAELRQRDPSLSAMIDAQLRENVRAQVMASIPESAAPLRTRVAAVVLEGIAVELVFAHILEALGDLAEELLRLLGIDRSGQRPGGAPA